MLGFRRDRKPALLRLRSSVSLIVTTVSFAVFTDVFLYSVIVPVLPFSLPSRAGISQDTVQYWISVSLAVFGAALLAASPIWGYVADRIQNRRAPMLAGLIFLVGATALLCATTNIPMLLAGRILQGLAAALTWTVGLALVVDTVDTKHIGYATGWIGMATSLGILTAPLVGGVVYGRAGYYSVFAMCFGLLAVDITLRLAIIEVKEAQKWLDVDAHSHPSDQETAQSRDVAIHPRDAQPEEKNAAPAVDTPEQARVEEPPAPVRLGRITHLLRKPRLLAALWGTLIHSLIQTSFDSILPLFVESVFGWDSVGAGLIFLPLVLPAFLSPLVGILGDRYGPKWLSAGGFLLATPFLVCLRFVTDDSMEHRVMLCGLLVGVGIAIALVFGPLMAEITWSVEAGEHESGVAPYALAYGLYNMAYSGGAICGPLLGGFIRDTAGWPTVGWVLGLITFVTAVTQALWIGGPLKKKASMDSSQSETM
ncbi:hypothetical protein S40285_00352 [Stachybotrys chlorohalonatus IBT 40285]|uniref:Major facilitator superfamily (MFS) profile domain-containing protein n=1 Tax=Stachybotrys chlorohalonatus (strain IBT 40285) TaxID=1283841 RepID=A0A084QHX3_STAC4|nr:hypothetical protein S40285_00352 [Stachybotrys chlorohalonata IBT 40285]